MANEKADEKNSKAPRFRFADAFQGRVIGPGGFSKPTFPGYEREYLADLNEAFRLGYRAALMEKA